MPITSTKKKRYVKFLFTVPSVREGGSKVYVAARQLAAIAERLAEEDRTYCNHRNSRPENVAEHSFMLSIVAPAIAEEFYPSLDANLVSRFCTIHDIVEAYVGDTPTHDIDADGLLIKGEIEQLGLEQLQAEYQHLQKFTDLATQYEEQRIPEARFVRVIDKWMPLALHFINEGSILKTFIDSDTLKENARKTAERLQREYPEFADLIAVRTEFAEKASSMCK